MNSQGLESVKTPTTQVQPPNAALKSNNDQQQPPTAQQAPVTPSGINQLPVQGRNATATNNKDRNLSTAKTAQSTPVNANPNANRTIGHYLVGKYFYFLINMQDDLWDKELLGK